MPTAGGRARPVRASGPAGRALHLHEPGAPLGCGDGACDPLEDRRSCPGDCAACEPVCGDFHCDAPETAATCANDCSP
ncbi:MAG: hypothetical protein R2939_12290 [Kofleriaceae bacterium]